MAPAGRPRISKEKRRRVNLMLDDNTYKYLKMVGDGSASNGIYLIVMHSMVNRIHDEVMKKPMPKRKPSPSSQPVIPQPPLLMSDITRKRTLVQKRR